MKSTGTLLFTSSALLVGRCQCFTPTHLLRLRPTSSSLSAPFLTRVLANPNGEGVNGDSEGVSAATAEDYFASAEVLEFGLAEHKPLGCRAEESLAEEPNGAKHVFVSTVNKDGFAAKAGIQVGDVIVGISGSFDDVVNVAGLGLDRVRSLIAGHPEEDPLVIRVARGTDVLERHETMLVNICTFNEGVDAEIEECIINLNTYDYGFEDDEPTIDCGDEDTECLIDQMYGEWGEEMSGMSPEELAAKEKEEEKEEPQKPKVAPWSSRSSPSGTFVRDPATGEMRNIDAQ